MSVTKLYVIWLLLVVVVLQLEKTFGKKNLPIFKAYVVQNRRKHINLPLV